ncbi:regulator of chromosome condensation 1/beta-lactamase-inhibitor protein II [Stachybotrys elegans]|uniref:Regulator of chromosome condensation 1/beta-lactamase-inhibitor protein II n=1 Tax=Stachybotrys elegans TaxID=80388 RepID=A0A8K0SS70_9HYPO|nr:regulator of chromosome condensation 1/beta-lactamase-inhibitor protein II [Stachybotrys elegans]
MELYATGFNAFRQLEFSQETQQDEQHEPDDLHRFTKILAGHQIEPPRVRLASTIVRVDGKILITGTRDQEDLESAFAAVETAAGDVFTIVRQPKDNHGLPGEQLRKNSRNAPEADPETWTCSVPIKQMAAYDVGVILLHTDGSVSTMGDPRFENCLGRPVSDAEPAWKPGKVIDLELVAPVKKVLGGGYTLVTVTEGGDLYAWGTASGGVHRPRQAFGSLDGTPNYQEVNEDEDVVDAALGESHALALTREGDLYGIGDNGNGQLGLGTEVMRVETWTKLAFDVPEGKEIVGLAAGPRSSFIITSTTPAEQ